MRPDWPLYCTMAVLAHPGELTISFVNPDKYFDVWACIYV